MAAMGKSHVGVALWSKEPTDEKYNRRCRHAVGSIGTGRTDAAEVFWNDDTGIQVFDPWGGVPQSSLFQTFENRGIALDETDGRTSWSDVLPLGAPGSAGVIRQGRTGSFATIASGLPRPAGVAFNHRSGMVYWTDLGDGAHPSAVYSASRDGSDPKSIISVIVAKSASLAVVVALGGGCLIPSCPGYGDVSTTVRS
jgi:hypothetical protein